MPASETPLGTGRRWEDRRKTPALSPKGRPVRNAQPQRDAWYEVQEGLRKVLEELRTRSR